MDCMKEQLRQRCDAMCISMFEPPLNKHEFQFRDRLIDDLLEFDSRGKIIVDVVRAVFSTHEKMEFRWSPPVLSPLQLTESSQTERILALPPPQSPNKVNMVCGADPELLPIEFSSPFTRRCFKIKQSKHRKEPALLSRVKKRTKVLHVELLRITSPAESECDLSCAVQPFPGTAQIKRKVPLSTSDSSSSVELATRSSKKSKRIKTRSRTRRVLPLQPPPAEDFNDDGQTFVPERIIDKRLIRKRIQYLVKFRKFPEDDSVWLYEEDICDTPEDRRRLTLKFEADLMRKENPSLGQ